MHVTLICTGRGTHEPRELFEYDGEIPVPDSWRASARSTVFELACWRSHHADPRVPLGGCGYRPRPSDAAMRAMVNAAAATPGKSFDVSYSGL